jgi:hypothetical protein
MEAARTLWGLSGGETVCVNAAEEELQRLKPLGFYALMSWPFEPVTDGLSG